MGAVLGVLVVPLLTLVMSPAGCPSPYHCSYSAIFWFANFRKTWDMHYIRLLLPTAIVGIVIGTFLLKTLDSGTLRHILGLFTLLFVVYKL